MPRRINHTLKWKRIDNFYSSNKASRSYRTNLTRTIRAEIHHCPAARSDGSGEPVFDLHLYWNYEVISITLHDSVEQAKGAVCNQINKVVADFIKAKQVADGTIMRMDQKRALHR